MTTRVWTDRSRILAYQRCPRSRFHEYHDGLTGAGMRKTRTDLPLAVGGSVHVGLATLLECTQGVPLAELSFELAEIKAVQAALADFAQYSAALELDTAEQAAMAPADFGAFIEDDPELAAIAHGGEQRRSEFDRYLASEQSALVEAMVRAYARRRLRPLLEQFEVLEVEREGTWELAHWDACDKCGSGPFIRQRGPLVEEQYPDGIYLCRRCGASKVGAEIDNVANELMFMSRPDALLLERQSRQLYLLSYKTTSEWDIRRQRDAEHDMQGLSEGIEIERRLAEWWRSEKDNTHDLNWTTIEMLDRGQSGPTESMRTFLRSCDAPPRILAVRYEFLMKGWRGLDKDLSAKFGMTVKSQRSHLIRGYASVGRNAKPGAWNWSWDYLKPDGSGESSKLAYVNWKSTPIWESMPIARWIDMLDEATMTQQTSADGDATGFVDARDVGYSCAAQTTGYTAKHPLDAAFVAPVTVYRNEDDLRDMVEQVEAQERAVAEAVAQIRAVTDAGDRRHLMNVHFPMHRSKCEYPGTCAFTKICYGGEDIRRDPLGSGQYVEREPNHPIERSST
jgi:hypothetical protein